MFSIFSGDGSSPFERQGTQPKQKANGHRGTKKAENIEYVFHLFGGWE